jgi:poly(3-hydroxybutyrate) depolymerase
VSLEQRAVQRDDNFWFTGSFPLWCMNPNELPESPPLVLVLHGYGMSNIHTSGQRSPADW